MTDDEITSNAQLLTDQRWASAQAQYHEWLTTEFRRVCGEKDAQYFIAERDEHLMLDILRRRKK